MDPVVEALKEGRVLFEGGGSLALGGTIADAEKAVGIDPERPKNRWQEKDELWGESWKLTRGFLWFKKGRHDGELVFHGDSFIRVEGPDDAWTDEGEAWSKEMFDHDVKQYDQAYERLVGRLGAPSDRIPGDETLKLAVWRFPKAALTLRWESRTPSLLVSVDRSGPPAWVFRKP
jgi:hypothetical protein